MKTKELAPEQLDAAKLAVTRFADAAPMQFFDKRDVAELIDISTVVDGDGSVDPKKLTAAIAALAEKKPYLLDPKKPKTGVDRGRERARAQFAPRKANG